MSLKGRRNLNMSNHLNWKGTRFEFLLCSFISFELVLSLVEVLMSVFEFFDFKRVSENDLFKFISLFILNFNFNEFLNVFPFI